MSSHHPETPCAQRTHWLRSQPKLPNAWSSDCWSCVIRVETVFVRGGWRCCLVRAYQAKRAASALVVPAHRRGRKSALTSAPLVDAIEAYRSGFLKDDCLVRGIVVNAVLFELNRGAREWRTWALTYD
jgi:hypothetical protein